MWHRSCGTRPDAMTPLHVPAMPVSRGSMSAARVGAREMNPLALPWVSAFALLLLWNPSPARGDGTTPNAAGETAPPGAVVPANLESNAKAGAAETGSAPVPASKLGPDSIAVAAPAARDSSSMASDAPGGL